MLCTRREELEQVVLRICKLKIMTSVEFESLLEITVQLEESFLWSAAITSPETGSGIC